jgi:hypothetical protein
MPNPKNFVNSEYTYVPGYVRRKKSGGSRNNEPFIGFLLVLLVMGLIVWGIIWFVTNFWIFIVIALVLGLCIFVIIKWKKWSLVFYSIGIIGFFLCLLFFFTLKTPSDELVNTVQIQKLSGVDNLSLFKIEAKLAPTTDTKPDQSYLVKLDNGVTTLDYYTSWNQLEINIKEVKTYSVSVSDDERSAWSMYPKYKMYVYEMHTAHNFLVLLIGIGIFALCFVLARYLFPKIFYYYK